MKKNTSPVTLNAGRSAALIIGILGLFMLILMLVTPTQRSTFIFVVMVFAAGLVACFITDHFSPARISLSTEGVSLRVRRTKQDVNLPWTSFSCMYELTGWKQSIYLFTPAPMEKEAQPAVYKACCKNKEVPFTHNGCLILNAHVHGNVIDPRIPTHIQKMPWKHCAKV